MAYLSLIEEEGVGIIRLGKPTTNAFNLKYAAELSEALDEVKEDDGIKVVVIASSLKDMFVAGADMKMFKSWIGSKIEKDNVGMFSMILEKLESIPKIVIAAINGPALGGGMELTLACDLRFMADGPGLLGLPEVTLGLLPGSGGTQRLPRLIGKTRAIEMLITGKTVDAGTALEMGLVNKIFPPDELLSGTLEFAGNLKGQATRAIGLIKHSVTQGGGLDMKEALDVEKEAMLKVLETEDAKEGINSFLERRKPTYKGK